MEVSHPRPLQVPGNWCHEVTRTITKIMKMIMIMQPFTSMILERRQFTPRTVPRPARQQWCTLVKVSLPFADFFIAQNQRFFKTCFTLFRASRGRHQFPANLGRPNDTLGWDKRNDIHAWEFLKDGSERAVCKGHARCGAARPGRARLHSGRGSPNAAVRFTQVNSISNLFGVSKFSCIIHAADRPTASQWVSRGPPAMRAMPLPQARGGPDEE